MKVAGCLRAFFVFSCFRGCLSLEKEPPGLLPFCASVMAGCLFRVFREFRAFRGHPYVIRMQRDIEFSAVSASSAFIRSCQALPS